MHLRGAKSFREVLDDLFGVTSSAVPSEQAASKGFEGSFMRVSRTLSHLEISTEEIDK